MPLHSQRQSLNPLEEKPRVIRCYAGTEIAQRHGPHAQNEGERRKRLRQVVPPAQSVIGIVRLVIERVLSTSPVERSGINNDSTDASSVATHPFGKRVDHDVSSMLDGSR